MKLFVYGTLRQGQSANDLLGDSKLLQTLKIPFGTLYNGWYPAYKCNGGTTGVIGEVYEVSEATLKKCDGYEGHPDLFRRCVVDTAIGEVCVYEYQGAVDKHFVKLEHGDWVRDYGNDTSEIVNSL